MSYTKRFGNVLMEIEQWNKYLWVARNPRLSVGYTAHTYDEVVARVESAMESHPENFVEKTDAEMRGMTEEEYQAMKEHGRRVVAKIKGEI